MLIITFTHERATDGNPGRMAVDGSVAFVGPFPINFLPCLIVFFLFLLVIFLLVVSGIIKHMCIAFSKAETKNLNYLDFAPLPWMAPAFRQRGFHFVSHNYRLAPQARVDEQLADCLEAVSWCRTNLPAVLGSDKVDVDRYVLVGESAGGHLATLMGLHLSSPAPKAIVDVYGVVDFISMPAFGAPEQRPSRTTQGPWNGKFSEETLNKLLRDRDPANALTDALPWNEHEFLTESEISKLWAAEFRYTDRVLMQAELHMMHSLSRSADGLRVGIMHNETFSSEDELMAFVRSMSPLRVLQERVTQGKKGLALYPPTAFLHGIGDVDVPVEQSYAMASVLKDAEVPVVESYEEGGLHVFDMKYTVRESAVRHQ
jgi:acetyl esterase/lipase